MMCVLSRATIPRRDEARRPSDKIEYGYVGFGSATALRSVHIITNGYYFFYSDVGVALWFPFTIIF